MSAPIIPWRYRIASRQSVPILGGLLGLLALLIALGYFYAREHILAITHAQVNQFVSSIIRQEDYTRQWIMRTTRPLVDSLEHTFAQSSFTLEKISAQIPPAISDARGKHYIQLTLVDGTSVHSAYYDSKGEVTEEKARIIFGTPRTVKEIRATHSAYWSPPFVDVNHIVHMRYTVPLKDEKRITYALLTSSLAIPWFMDRIRSFSFFKQCIPFFLTEEGDWTLPDSTDKNIANLKTRMLENSRGITSVTWKGVRYIAVFLPSTETGLLIGVLIPRTDLFGHLDTITKTLVIVGIIIILLASYALHKTCKTLLQPLTHLIQVANKLAHGKLSDSAEKTDILNTKFHLETEKLQHATSRLRVALHQRMRDLTIMAQTRERLHGELAFARTIQNSLRPNPLPHIPHVSVAAHVHEAREVCGDMYDFFQLNEDEVCCVIGNVAEHGVPAALLTNRIMPSLHALILSGLSPGKALEHVNRVFETNRDSRGLFISALVGILHTKTGTFTWASAGQIPPFVLKDSVVCQLPWSENVPLGIRAHEQYEEREFCIDSDQTLLFIPLRLLSILNPEGHVYGEKRLETLLSHCDHTPKALLNVLFEDILTHAQSSLRDDIVLFAMQWHKDANK